MNINKTVIKSIILLTIICFSCKVTEFPLTQHFPQQVDTSTRPSANQEKKIYSEEMDGRSILRHKKSMILSLQLTG